MNTAKKVGRLLAERQLTLAAAESCTGGWVAQALTAVPGCSDWFERGFVTYTNIAKQEMLDVRPNTLKQYGAVSEQTAREMAEGALKHSHADIALSVTGIAGPTGGTPQKPIGTVWFAWTSKSFETAAKRQCFSGDRENVRKCSVEFVLTELIALITK